MLGFWVRSLAAVLGFVGTSFLLPVAVALACGEYRSLLSFAVPMAGSWALAAAFWRPRGQPPLARLAGLRQNAFVIVGSAWVAVSVFGAVPLYASGTYPSFVDALFESVSGFTTTGATVLSDVESLPRSVNLWRCQTHWLGGMGVIALAVALLPMLGVGGYWLVQAETSGPEKGKLTARISDTAKILWLIYGTLTLVQAVLLRLFGMDWFEAVCHAFSTLGTGGFSTRNASLASFANPALDWTCTVFMLLASVNFGLYYRLVKRQWAMVGENTELRGFVFLVLGAVAGATLVLWGQWGALGPAVRHAAFQVASLVSTTGFMSSDYAQWHPAAQLVLLALFLVGGCSGSTAGGVKVIRWSVLAKQVRNDILRLQHPHGVFALRIDGAPNRNALVATVGSFIFVYFALVLATALAGACEGLDLHTAFTAALSMVGNVGPAFGALGPTANCGFLPPALKLWYCFAMLAGRLEVYTLLILVGRSVLFPEGRK